MKSSILPADEVGYPACHVMLGPHDVMRAQLAEDIGVELADRHGVGHRPIPRGFAEQAPLHGNETKDNLAGLPQPFNALLPRFLTEFCFGDFIHPGGVALPQRELIVLCALATIGDTSAQLGPRGDACLQIGNSKAAAVAALVHCFPHITNLMGTPAGRSLRSVQVDPLGNRWHAIVV